MASKIEEFVVQALVKYYNNDYDMFFEYLDDNVIWYGPKEGQCIVGKRNLQKALSWGDRRTKFIVENIVTQLASYSQSLYSVLITYRLYSHWPDGTVREHLQHLILNGHKCRDQNGEIFWRCPFIHVSDVIPKKTVRLPGDEGFSRVIIKDEKVSNRLVFPGENYSSIYIAENALRYVVGGKGVCCYIHTENEVYKVNRLLKDVLEQLPDYYYRCHSSYIVNLRHVRCLSSSGVTMDDGTSIPIPVKRLAQIRQEITDLMGKLRDL